jgi:hypothetical protein
MTSSKNNITGCHLKVICRLLFLLYEMRETEFRSSENPLLFETTGLKANIKFIARRAWFGVRKFLRSSVIT